jgi:hypothetical protein
MIKDFFIYFLKKMIVGQYGYPQRNVLDSSDYDLSDFAPLRLCVK